jgi:hypothetical protein
MVEYMIGISVEWLIYQDCLESAVHSRSSLFWYVTWWWYVVSTHVLGHPISSIFKGQDCLTLLLLCPLPILPLSIPPLLPPLPLLIPPPLLHPPSSFSTYSSSSSITALSEPRPLPELPSTALSPATYVSSSSHSCSFDLPQLTKATST